MKEKAIHRLYPGWVRDVLMSLMAISFVILAALPLSAQVHVEQKIDPIGMYIGQQTVLEVDVTASKDAKVQFPHYERTQYMVPGVEVLSMADDTVDGKEYKGNQLALKVVDVENVDTLHPNQFFPPKDVQDNPFLWSDWSGAFWMSIIVLLLAVLAYYLFIRLKENKPIITRIRIIKRLLPHQKAMGEIEKIKAEQMVMSENQKEYYTKLTDTLRQYIVERFGFNAMEMTSSEIIQHLRESGDQKMIDELKELFNTADLVKFAKYQTLINENDLNLVNAINFINQTKLEGEATEERIVPKLSDEDKRSQQSRKVIKVLLWVVAVIIVAMVVYIIYNIGQLLG